MRYIPDLAVKDDEMGRVSAVHRHQPPCKRARAVLAGCADSGAAGAVWVRRQNDLYGSLVLPARQRNDRS